MQNLKLITKMTLVSWFGPIGGLRKHLQIKELYFCMFATSLLVCTGLLDKNSWRPRLASAALWAGRTFGKIQFPNFIWDWGSLSISYHVTVIG